MGIITVVVALFVESSNRYRKAAPVTIQGEVMGTRSRESPHFAHMKIELV